MTKYMYVESSLSHYVMTYVYVCDPNRPRPLKPELDEGRAQLALNSLATVAASVLSASTVSSASAVSSLPRATTTTTMALTSLEAAVSDTSFLTTAPIPAEMKKFLNGDSKSYSPFPLSPFLFPSFHCL